MFKTPFICQSNRCRHKKIKKQTLKKPEEDEEILFFNFNPLRSGLHTEALRTRVGYKEQPAL